MKGAFGLRPKTSRDRNCEHVAHQPDQYPLTPEAEAIGTLIRPQHDNGTSRAQLREAWGVCP